MDNKKTISHKPTCSSNDPSCGFQAGCDCRLSAKERKRLERAMCAIVDNEGVIKDALTANGHTPYGVHDMCDALRLIVDGD